METLRTRASIVKTIRCFFDKRGFFEVETPLLSHDIVIDQHLHPIQVDKQAVTASTEDSGESMWLQTSPEFAMKRLLTSGAQSIYQICKAFRQGEAGRFHNPEFTMLEWYRVGDDYLAGMDLLDEFIQTILDTPPAIRMTYRDAFVEFAGIEPFRSRQTTLAAAAGADVEEPRDELLNLILSSQVEPKLGLSGVPVILYDYPASQAALAKVREEEYSIAERFEVYLNGVELANGYHELTDADELRRRGSQANQCRVQDGKCALPEESRLLTAMDHGLPSCSGTAVGVDRLVMLATKNESIEGVIPF
ncbi:UNVERIFIED_CONTAM: hypothetical protein GTU68_056757, partial [Idotea baltica]|nr:hypothetical protein [Idotea baltica]